MPVREVLKIEGVLLVGIRINAISIITLDMALSLKR